ncbi:MAG: efflux RND transporter periplasmic adaptor subunit [Gammaproteobacteria bacterium]|nr:efflux RND transporter periplasmic adaptor subunit [Gammaproteobacteria bacterium]
MNLRTFSAALALLVSLPLAQANEFLPLSQAQSEAMGLHLAPPIPAKTAAGPAWPGQVVMPPDGHELLIAPLNGRVVRVHAASGAAVQGGEPLVTLFSPMLVQLVQDYLRAQANEDLARQTLSREQRLMREGIGIERRVREAEIALRQAHAETQGLATRLTLAGLDPKRLSQGQVGAELVIRAPRPGSVLMLHTTPGAWLDEGAVAVELGYTERRWVEADLPLEQVGGVLPSQPVSIEPGGLRGLVLAIAPTAEPQRQTVRVRIELPQGSTLRPGQRVQVRFEEAGTLWRIPASALVNLNGQEVIFVQRQEGVQPLTVEVRSRSHETALLGGALTAEDRIVIRGAMAIKAAWQSQHEAK